jgi:hypothetical protein
VNRLQVCGGVLVRSMPLMVDVAGREKHKKGADEARAGGRNYLLKNKTAYPKRQRSPRGAPLAEHDLREGPSE